MTVTQETDKQNNRINFGEIAATYKNWETYAECGENGIPIILVKLWPCIKYGIEGGMRRESQTKRRNNLDKFEAMFKTEYQMRIAKNKRLR